MSEPLATIINKERDRLTKGLADLQAKQNELEAQRATLETELDALDAYEAARSGKTRKSRGTAARAPRGLPATISSRGHRQIQEGDDPR
jgi:uncharacterized protein YlxW (UPF0749 family)